MYLLVEVKAISDDTPIVEQVLMVVDEDGSAVWLVASEYPLEMNVIATRSVSEQDLPDGYTHEDVAKLIEQTERLRCNGMHEVKCMLCDHKEIVGRGVLSFMCQPCCDALDKTVTRISHTQKGNKQ